MVFAGSPAVLTIATGSIWSAVGWHAGTDATSITVLDGLGLHPDGPTWLVGTNWSDGLLGLGTSVVAALAALGLAAWAAVGRAQGRRAAPPVPWGIERRSGWEGAPRGRPCRDAVRR